MGPVVGIQNSILELDKGGDEKSGSPKTHLVTKSGQELFQGDLLPDLKAEQREVDVPYSGVIAIVTEIDPCQFELTAHPEETCLRPLARIREALSDNPPPSAKPTFSCFLISKAVEDLKNGSSGLDLQSILG